ncbi:MAG: aminotransferase class IV [Hyphomicrobiaceae bacterium]
MTTASPLPAASTGASTHEYVDDPRNASILISVNGRLVPRPDAVVSVFDSGFILGDGVWEGLRFTDGGIPFLDQHMERLYEGARSIYMDIGLTPDAMKQRLFACLAANKMQDGVHIRLMVTRGVKRTPYQDPRVTIGPATVVIIPEYKTPKPEVAKRGLKLFTVHVRRTGPDQQDQKLNSHSKLNCILACVQAAQAGADEALMLDPLGHVATCNSTHFFIVRRGELWTSSGMYCLGGITRGNVLRAARDAGIPAFEKDFSLVDVYGADEAFVTGTFAGLTPVIDVDGRKLGHPTRPVPPHADGGAAGPMTRRLNDLYKALAARETVRA